MVYVRASCARQHRACARREAIKTLTPLDVELAIDAWRAMPKGKDGKETLSRRSVFNIFTTLRTALNKAVAWQRIAENPCDRVDAPKRGTAQSAPSTIDVLHRVLLHLHERHLFVPVLFLGTTGVRRNEMLGVTRDAIDFDRGVVNIKRAQTRMLDGTLGLKATKTDKPREVPLCAPLAEALRDHLSKTSGDLVFPHPQSGGHWHFATFSTALRDASKQIGVSLSAQRIRRIFSEVAKRGVADRVVAEVLGHSVQMNARSYNDIALDSKREATDFVGTLVANFVAKSGLTLEKP